MYNSDPSMAGDENACFGLSEDCRRKTPIIRARRIPVFHKALIGGYSRSAVLGVRGAAARRKRSRSSQRDRCIARAEFQRSRRQALWAWSPITRDWRPTARPRLIFCFDRMRAALSRFFSPEHGIRGTLDAKFDTTVDDATGLPIYSLYGDVKRPSARDA